MNDTFMTPQTEFAFRLGQQDFHRGKLANAFQPNTDVAKEWDRGFNQAYFANLKQVQGREQALAA